jgi:hypothetical protein
MEYVAGGSPGVTFFGVTNSLLSLETEY